ncbi:MAG: SIMPL domain-containing protein [Myxococcales bacterium]|jgi:uncharacterized protein YggE|nr:SIMPL domain-containing protein [Myxococcales bacterium]
MTRWMRSSALIVALGVGAVGCAHRGRSIEVRGASSPEGVRVSGQGEVKARPDVARATLGVEARAASAAEAVEQVSRTMQQVLAAVRAEGIVDADLQTEQVSVFFEQEFPPTPPPRPLPQEGEGAAGAVEAAPAGPRGFYRASNTVRVTVRDLAKTSAILSAATQAGANAVHGLAFEIDDPKPHLAQARAEAVRDAHEQAEQLAKLTGAKLGRVLAISTQPQGGMRFGSSAAAPMMMKEHAQVPVEPGELTVQQHVEILYAIEARDD